MLDLGLVAEELLLPTELYTCFEMGMLVADRFQFHRISHRCSAITGSTLARY